jgi:urea transport system permease protein
VNSTKPTLNDINGAAITDAAGTRKTATSRLKADPMLIAILACFLLPLVIADSATNNLAYCLVWTFAAIGLSAMWGYGGILSFGQTAFFGLAGYAYGVFTLNMGESPLSTSSL